MRKPYYPSPISTDQAEVGEGQKVPSHFLGTGCSRGQCRHSSVASHLALGCHLYPDWLGVPESWGLNCSMDKILWCKMALTSQSLQAPFDRSWSTCESSAMMSHSHFIWAVYSMGGYQFDLNDHNDHKLEVSSTNGPVNVTVTSSSSRSWGLHRPAAEARRAKLPAYLHQYKCPDHLYRSNDCSWKSYEKYTVLFSRLSVKVTHRSLVWKTGLWS